MICLTRSSRNCQMSPLFERMIPRCISLFFNPFLSFPPPYLERSPPFPAQKEEMGEGPKTQNPFSLSSLLAIKWEVDGGRTAATLENRHRFLQVLNVVAKIRPIVAPDYRKAPTLDLQKHWYVRYINPFVVVQTDGNSLLTKTYERQSTMHCFIGNPFLPVGSHPLNPPLFFRTWALAGVPSTTE